MNFVISKNARLINDKSEAKNKMSHRKNNMLELNIYKAIEYRNQEADRNAAVDKYMYIRGM